MRTISQLFVVFSAVFLPGSLRAQDACVPGSVKFGDVDQRGDVAAIDLAAFAECSAGPDKTPSPSLPLLAGECLVAFDSDEDNDVDAIDAARFQREYTGECIGLGECPAGMHLEHTSGQVGLVSYTGLEDDGDVGEFTPHAPPPLPHEYRCVADETCKGVDCSGHGQCEVLSGRAACACKPGYAGDSCERCATGYQLNRAKECVLGSECRERLCSGQGDCREEGQDIVCDCDKDARGEHCEDGGSGGPNFRAPTYVEIEGTERSIQQGEQRQICATTFGGGLIAPQLTWSIEGPGAFTTSPTCMFYVAPQAGSFADSQIVEIRACSQMFPDQCAVRYLTIDPPGGIRSSGQANGALKPFDDAMKQFMLHRCVGGAVLGVSVFGKPVYVRGYGNLSGAPTNDPEYLAACGDRFNITGTVPGISLPPPSEVQPNSPFRVGSISKSVAAAILRKHVKEEFPALDTDADVEALGLCEGILPNALHDVACLGQPTPLNLASLSGSPPDCDSDDPCPYGGTCVVTDEETGIGYCDDCPAGQTGLDCSRDMDHCPPGQADDRWPSITLGRLLGHRSGLPRSAPSVFSVILPGLFQLRGLMDESDWADQEDALVAEVQWPNGTFDAEFPKFGNALNELGPNYYFPPRPTVEDAVLARMGNCLATAPGTNTAYSNTGYALVGPIVEEITGREFAGRAGKPGLHNGSLLEEFADEELGLPLAGQGTNEGIFHSQDVFDLRNTEEPVYREWSVVTNTYYKPVNDEKRPYCEWNDGLGLCLFNEWTDAADRYDWRFEDQKVLTGYQGGSIGGPSTAGSLATEAEVFLRFMSKYWVGGDGPDPRYGQTRCPNGNCIWNLATGHNGARDGTYAEAKQLGGPWKPIPQGNCVDDGDCSTYTACNNTDQEQNNVQEFCRGGKCWRYNEYSVPPVDPVTGDITDDFANSECHKCRLPVGVDIFVAINQGSDKKCRDAQDLDPSDPDYYTCSSAYGMLANFMIHAACQVQWPVNPFVLWPPVFEDGGSSMSPQFAGP